jgi:O-antigen/teichoic acid export membrane protein
LTHDADHPRGDLAGSVVRGVGWMMASQSATQVLALLTSVVVARFLGPREVGLAAEALVFGSLALVIVDFGFGSVIIQRPTLSEEDRSTAFWAGALLGVALTLIGIGLSWPIASLYGEPQVQPLFAVLSVSFLFTAPSVVQGALLTREMRFRSLEVRTIIATTVSCATAMALAALGFGAWAIVAQDLVITSVGAALLWRASPWRPRATFSIASLKGMGRYTSHVFGTKALRWGTINLDNFLIGRFLGASPLGAYSLAYSTMIAPVQRIANPTLQVFFPAFSKMRDPERIAAAWIRATRMMALVVVPAMLGLIVVAPEFVTAVFGEKWHAAVPVIQILAPVGLLQTLTALNAGVLQALDRTRPLFRFTLVLSITTVGAFVAGLPWGIDGVATAFLIVTLALQPVFLLLTTRAVGLTIWDWLRSFAGVMEAGVAMLVVVLGARELLVGTDLKAGALLVALTAIGVIVYVPLVAWREPDVRVELRGLRERLRRRVRPAPVSESSEAPV